MTRKILCPLCFKGRYQLNERDRFNGYEERTDTFEVIIPAQHGYEFMGEHIPVYEVTCDNCQIALHNGATVCTVTLWKARGFQSEPEPPRWENEFKRIR